MVECVKLKYDLDESNLVGCGRTWGMFNLMALSQVISIHQLKTAIGDAKKNDFKQ